MRVTFDPGVGRMSSRKCEIRCIRGSGFTGCPTKGAFPIFGGICAIASVCYSTGARSSVGSGSFSVSMITNSFWVLLLVSSHHLPVFEDHEAQVTRIPIYKAYLYLVKNTTLK